MKNNFITQEKFEKIMNQQKEKEITVLHIGCFRNNHIYENFAFESSQIEYRFTDSNIISPDDELVVSSILKNNITYFQYFELGHQIEVKLSDNNRVIIDLSDDFNMEEHNSDSFKMEVN